MEPIERRRFMKGMAAGVLAITLTPSQARAQNVPLRLLKRSEADTLEALWNDKLRQPEQAREDYEKQRESGERETGAFSSYQALMSELS